MATEHPSDDIDPEQVTFDDSFGEEETTTPQDQSKTPPTPRVLFYSHGDNPWGRNRGPARYARDNLGRDDLTDERIEGMVNRDTPLNVACYGDSAESHPEALNNAIVAVEEHSVSHVVVPELTDLSWSWRDVYDVVDTLTDSGVTVHSVRDDLVIEPKSGELDSLRVVADSERREVIEGAKRRLQTRETGDWTGRPPIGFTSQNGVLVPADGYNELVAVLEKVDSDPTQSVYWASIETGYSRDAINQALNDPERRELYGLDPHNDE